MTPVVAPPHPIDLSLPITSTYLRRMRAFGAIQAEYQAAAAAAAAAVAADRRSRWSGTDYEPSVSDTLVPILHRSVLSIRVYNETIKQVAKRVLTLNQQSRKV